MQAFAAPLLGAAVKWTKPENLHLTYVFLGDVPAARAPAAAGCVARCAAIFTRQEVHLSGLGAFPSLEKPRVFWLGLAQDSAGTLKELTLKLSAALEAEGFKFDFNFTPHLTIGRVKTKLAPALTAKLRGKADALEGRSIINSVELFESRLTSSCPEYRGLASSPLL